MKVTVDDVRVYLKVYRNKAASTYRNQICSLRRFFRDFLQMDIVETFEMPPKPIIPKRIPTKEQVQKFYYALEPLKERTLYLFYATTGLRKSKVLSATFEDVDLSGRTIVFDSAMSNTTKRTWVAFYNEEAERDLKEYLATRKDSNPKLFPIRTSKFKAMWKNAKEKTGIRITPQILRQWFCCRMGELGVQDRYIDAFCGRVPKSVLARHYTDYSPERLKRIYDRANLKVLS